MRIYVLMQLGVIAIFSRNLVRMCISSYLSGTNITEKFFTKELAIFQNLSNGILLDASISAWVLN